MAPVDTIASINLLATMHKAVLAIACCDAMSAVAVPDPDPDPEASFAFN